MYKIKKIKILSIVLGILIEILDNLFKSGPIIKRIWKRMMVMDYKYYCLAQVQLNKLVRQQGSTLSEGIAYDKLIGMKLLPDNDHVVESNDSYWDSFKPSKI